MMTIIFPKHSLKLAALGLTVAVAFMVAIAPQVQAQGAQAENTDAAPQLDWPLACKLFQDCFIDNYPDLKLGTDPVFPVDYKCGHRTRPGTNGVEIVFTDRKTARMSKSVLAAADGRVTYVEDGIDEGRQYSKSSKRACGNHVVVRHNPSYSTKYCYMRENTISVKAGDTVRAGDVLGQVGSSGSTEAPKFYFEVTNKNIPVDPFSGRTLNKPSECFSLNDKPLWRAAYPYPPVGIMAASFAQGYPTAHDIDYDASVTQALPRSLRSLTAWVKVFGVQKGDKETLTIKKPNGQEWFENERVHFADAPFWTSFANASFQPDVWPEAGEWTATYTLQREGEVIVRYDFFVTIQ